MRDERHFAHQATGMNNGEELYYKFCNMDEKLMLDHLHARPGV